MLGVDLAVEPTGLLTGLPRAPGPVPSGAADRPAAAAHAGARGRDRRPAAPPRHRPRARRRPGRGPARRRRLGPVVPPGLRHAPARRAGRAGRRPGAVAEPGAGDPATAPVPPASPLRPPWLLLGPDSEVGRAVLARRPDVARAVLARWAAALPPGGSRRRGRLPPRPPGRPGERRPRRPDARARPRRRRAGRPHERRAATSTPADAATADVLDAARRLVPLDARHLDRVSAQGYLAGPGTWAVAAEVAAPPTTRAGRGRRPARGHRRPRRPVPARPPRRPRHRLRPPAREPRPRPGGDRGRRRPVAQALRGGDRPAGTRGCPRAGCEQVVHRLDDELDTIARLGFASYFLTVEEVVQPGQRARRAGGGARVRRRQPGQPPARHLGRRPDPATTC